MKHPEFFPSKKNDRIPLEFKNKWGQTYYVKSSTTKTGKTTFVVTKTLTEDCVSKLPDGFEVADIPTSGQFVVRKKLPTVFTNTEVQIIEKELKKNKALSDYKIDIRGDILSIFVKDKPNLLDFGSMFPKHLLEMIGNFEEKMRVKIVIRGNSRNYIFERFNFRGSVDDWMTIGTGTDLHELAQKFIRHLGLESYFEIGCGF